MPELFVFKAGKYPQGDWPEERVRKLVDAYDPEIMNAPVVIGHRFFAMRDADQYAHGWVESLRMDKDGKVYANIPEFSLEARHAITERKLQYVSVEIFEFDKEDKDKSPYLKAAALLGRDTPAVRGTKIPALFSLAAGGVVNTVSEESDISISTFTRKVSAEEYKILSASGQENHEGEEMDKSSGSPAAETLSARLEESEKQIAAFKKENEELKNAGRKQDAEAFYSRLRDGGKLTPAQFEKAVALDVKLTAGDDRKEFRALFSDLETKVDLSGKHTADKKNAPAPAASDADLTAKIRAFQAEKKLASFEEAAKALMAENPGLFEEEETHD
jgi:hypothetical protein